MKPDPNGTRPGSGLGLNPGSQGLNLNLGIHNWVCPTKHQSDWRFGSVPTGGCISVKLENIMETLTLES
jgi:hypothetical protein